MRVVIDTNVFINGIFKKDQFCKAIFRLKSLNKITLVMNKDMQNELFITFGNIINSNYCTEDESDNKFVDCCIDGNVTYLITQDNHINSKQAELRKDYGIEVLSPFQFYFRFKSNKL